MKTTLSLFYFEKMITKHKFLEIQIDLGYWSSFDFSMTGRFALNIDDIGAELYLFGNLFTIWWNREGDHAGFSFSLSGWLGLFNFEIRDHRHWNWDTNTWEVYPENESVPKQ